MGDMLYAGNKVLYLVLILSAGPICVATIVGLLVGLIQTVTQLQEQTLPFGIKLLSVTLCIFLMSGWYSEILLNYSREVFRFALSS
ncbi:EscS/YscS/HrcS family type III secretion system export apparatus protein [Rouxiella sp. T17]|uniref:EscS/YscS/HrcS family type III secretion system export apparatus protein n=1 Tax=Rouxiella sp. T17 TaxID=3085684 RepID=UPI002FCB1763